MSEELFVGPMTDAMVDSMFSDDAPAQDAAATEEPSAVETEVPAVEDAPAADETVDEAPAVEDAPASEQNDDTTEPAAEAATDGEAKDELPEGVTVREKNGRKEWVYPEDRARSIYEGYKIAKDAETVLGEPLSLDALKERQYAHEWLSNQRTDLISDNVTDQRNIFSNLIREAAVALNEGEIGHDPIETLPDAFAETLQRMAPEHYEAFSRKMLVSNLDSLYRAAHESKNEKLLRSVQNLDHYLTKSYRKDEDVAKMTTDPIAAREQELSQRERAIQERTVNEAKQQFRAWHQNVTGSVNTAVAESINSQIPESVRKAFESTPDGKQRIDNISRLLRMEVQESLRNDQNWQQQNKNLLKQAQLAPSEQRREAIKTQIVQRYQQRARQVMAAKAKAIIGAETLGLQKANAATIDRNRTAATQKGSTPNARPATRSAPADAASSQNWEDFLRSA